MRIEKRKIKDLKAAPYNPRKSTKEQEKALRQSLEKFGVVEPIIVNNKTGNIVGGHFRIRELKKLKHTEVDCVIVDLSEEDEKELNIRLNANTGEWDIESLMDNWDIEQLSDWGLDIEWPEINNEPKKEKDISDKVKAIYLVEITYETEEEQEEVYNKVAGLGHECRILTI